MQGTKVGLLTSYTQQLMMSRVAGNAQPDPRNDLITDLEQFVKEQCNNRTLAVSIFIDANKMLGDEANGLQRLTASLNLTDAYDTLLGDESPASYL